MLKLIVLTILMTSPVFAQDQAATGLQAAGCGPTETMFDVKIDEKLHTTGQPEEGKALVYVFADQLGDTTKVWFDRPTTRIGIDGTWAGALRLKSYLYFSVNPGEHRLCSSLQSKNKRQTNDLSAATTFTAESGKTYYFRTKTPDAPQKDDAVKIVSIDPAQAQIMLGSWALTTFKAKK